MLAFWTRCSRTLGGHRACKADKYPKSTDQEKLEEYLTSIRDVESKIELALAHSEKEAKNARKAIVGMDRRSQPRSDQTPLSQRSKPKADSGVIEGDDEDFVDLAYPYNTSVMYELMALALQANLTNVITFGHPGGNRLFPFDGITYGYHSLTHHGKTCVRTCSRS